MEFFLGGAITDDGERTREPVRYRPSDLTTHGVIVGMTGSGKTGLGVIYLEEALRQGIPCLVIDPKGDMTNLLLTFPELAAEDFLPWIDQAAVAREGLTPEEEAGTEATKWRDGLASWNLGPSDIGALRDRVGMTIYTPGSAAGIPINVVGDLRAPELSWDTEAEAMRDEIQGFVSGLLGLIDVEADPIASREHILLANLIEHAWAAGRDLTLEDLISQIIVPPLRRLGVFDVDSFFPEKDRTRLAMRLNSLLASPSFASWMEGDVLDIDSMMWHDGKPQAAIVYLAHLSDAERQFVVTTVLGKLITWMRSQQGSSELRLLTYMDEVFGFVPPTAEPPAKRPILTLLKQARAFGVGLLLSTQNPVDLDYKAMSNAGTWCVGRLQTERDKARILEAMTAASGGIDVGAVDSLISALDKREFLLHSTRDDEPLHFSTRWAMSYLRGPMTKEEVASVANDGQPPEPRAVQPAHAPFEDPTSSSTETSAPPVAEGIPVSALHPATTWADIVGWEPDGAQYHATIAITVSMRFDESRDGIDHIEQWEAVAPTLSADPEAISFVEVDHDPRDFVAVDNDIPFVAPEAPIGDSQWFTKLGRVVKAHLDVSETLELLRNDDLDLVSRPGESIDDFRSRCAQTAREGSDDEMAALRDRYEKRIRKARRDYESAVREADSAVAAQNAATSDAILGAGLDLLMGRRPRASTSSNRSTASKVRRAEDKVERTRASYEDLAHDLDDELASIQQQWDERIPEIAPFSVGLELDDIHIGEIRVVWVRRTI